MVLLLLQQPLEHGGGRRSDAATFLGRRSSSSRQLQEVDTDEGDNTEGDEPVLVPQKPMGDEACPCLTRDQLDTLYADIDLEDVTIDHDGNATANATGSVLSLSAENALYGLGCAPHDLDTDKCQNLEECTTVFPVPDDCDNTWCQRSWCLRGPRTVRGANVAKRRVRRIGRSQHFALFVCHVRAPGRFHPRKLRHAWLT